MVQQNNINSLHRPGTSTLIPKLEIVNEWITSIDDNHNLSDVQIESLKQERFDNWVNHITTMSNQPPVDPNITDVQPK